MRNFLSLILFALIAIFNQVACASKQPNLLPNYQFGETRHLVRFVNRAADYFHKHGLKALPDFAKTDGPWRHREEYVFIFSLDGTCIFNAATPFLEQRNLINNKDLTGKLTIQDIVNVTSRKKDPTGWVHYLWAEPDQIIPRWKTSYVRQVTGPDGKLYAIGAGLYNMRIEKAFIEHTVNKAVSFLKKEGMGQVKELTSPSSAFVYQNVAVYVFDMKGNLIVDPAFPNFDTKVPMRPHRNIYNFKDAAGQYTIRSMIKRVQHNKSAWVMYMWPHVDDVKPSRKIAFIRKVKLGGRYYIVGSDMFLENPIWMPN